MWECVSVNLICAQASPGRGDVDASVLAADVRAAEAQQAWREAESARREVEAKLAAIEVCACAYVSVCVCVYCMCGCICAGVCVLSVTPSCYIIVILCGLGCFTAARP